ncbi:MAG: DUF3109 family protein [Bacteroidales bacterium]|nr:DUF3109 family protein [Bacteroidales bacterium]
MKKKYDHCIIQIDGFLVSSEIITEYFACDYEACKGACCVIGDSGAPLTEDEAEEIERNYAAFSPLMTRDGREAIDREGFFEIDRDGEMVTPLVAPHGSGEGSMGENRDERGQCETGIYNKVGGPNDRECAYTCFDCDGACFCSIERKWFAGESSFRKPASCHLYPIRVTEFPDGTKALNLHRWEICKAAFEKGRRENVRVYEFLEEPIRQYFGSELYTALKQCAQRLL